jgi:hypothetical protein
MDLFNDLFAMRVQYQYMSYNEYMIIWELKQYAYNNGISLDELNDTIFQFYISFDLSITFVEINNVIFNPINFNIDDNNMNNIDENNIDENNINNIDENNINNIDEDNINIDENNINIDENIINNIDMIIADIIGIHQGHNINHFVLDLYPVNNLFDNIPNTEHLNDIVVTTDESELNKIQVNILDKEILDKCSICMFSFEIGDKFLDIECKHIFHQECLTTYLQNYNHICPICRKEIGKIKINY